MDKTRNKENAIWDFVEMIRKSWTYNVLTWYEKDRVEDILFSVKLSGSWKQRWCVLQSVYSAFLEGLGYRYNPISFRDSMKEVGRKKEVAL